MFRGNQNDRGQGGLTSASTPPTHPHTRWVDNPSGAPTPQPNGLPSGPSHVPCPLSLLFSGCHVQMPGKPHSGLSKRIPRCSHAPGPQFTEVPLPASSFQFRCYLLSEAFSHLSSQEEVLARHHTSASPKDMPSGLRSLTDIYGLAEATLTPCW